MTGRRVLEPLLWTLALLGAGLGTRGWLAAGRPAQAPDLAALAPPDAAPSPSGDSVARAAAYVARHDPFRLSRRPATVGYTVAAEGAPPPPPAPPKPSLVLRGIVGIGPRWQAVLDGLPGREGSVLLAQGDTAGLFRVTRIGRDTVTVQGADTTWKLTVRRQWQ